jgi:hypothetical protein
MRLIPTSITRKTVDPNDPTGGMTLDALMLRQKQLQQQRPEIPAQIASPWQGAALMANSFVNSMQQRQAQEQEAAGRQKLAETIGGINYDTGATPEQTALLMRLDPDTGMKFISEAIAARRAAAQQAHDDMMTRAGWAHQDTAAGTAFDREKTLADSNYARNRADTVTDRADTQRFQTGQAQAGYEHADTAAATARDADLAAKTVTHITGDDAKAQNLDPTKVWEFNPTTKQATDITPKIDPNAPGGGRDFEQTTKLKQAYLGQGAYKNYSIVKNAYDNMKSAATLGTGPGDIALITGYMKLLDPNSVVREGEFATAANAGGVPDKVRNIYNAALNGSKLQPGQRTEFLRSALNVYNNAAVQIKDLNKSFGSTASAFNVDPSLVIEEPPDYSHDFDPPGGSQSTQFGPPMPVPDDLTKLVPGQTYIDHQGQAATYNGGDPNQGQSWKLVGTQGGG